MAKHETTNAADETSGGAVELDDASTAEELGTSAAGAPRHGFFVRLYTGTGAFDVVGKRKLWFGISGAIILIALASILLRGFTFGIDFAGRHPGVPARVGRARTGDDPAGGGRLLQDARQGSRVGGPGRQRRIGDHPDPRGDAEQPGHRQAADGAVRRVPAEGRRRPAERAGHQRLGGVVRPGAVRSPRRPSSRWSCSWCWSSSTSPSATSGTWPSRRWPPLVFDLLTTAGVYSLVGFEVTPATVIGLLTILGFSLYDTVIVFDKVEENVHGFEHTARRTFAEQANLAINQTFMRSINTSLISVLPILALIVVAVWLLGVGTLQDLALVQLVGVIVGYVLVDLLRDATAGRACGNAPTWCARTPVASTTGARARSAKPSRRSRPRRRPSRRRCRRRHPSRASAAPPRAGQAGTGRQADPSHR